MALECFDSHVWMQWQTQPAGFIQRCDNRTCLGTRYGQKSWIKKRATLAIFAAWLQRWRGPVSPVSPVTFCRVWLRFAAGWGADAFRCNGQEQSYPGTARAWIRPCQASWRPAVTLLWHGSLKDGQIEVRGGSSQIFWDGSRKFGEKWSSFPCLLWVAALGWAYWRPPERL